MRRLIPLALALSATSLSAQSILDAGVRAGPQFIQYKIAAPTNSTISEFAVPMFVLVPLTPSLSFDIGSSYASAHVDQTGATKTVSSNISGLTDTQIRANYTMGNDVVVLTAGVNLPTGRSTAQVDEQLAAGLIASDFLLFPIANMGTGFGGTGGVAFARPLGDNWNFGGGVSVRKSTDYTPFAAGGTGTALRYQPGDEYRARVGVDRAVGTGRFTIGFTYSKFGNDNLAGSIYNTGDRYMTQFSYVNALGTGDLAIVGWNLYRHAGTLADSSFLGHEDVGNVSVSYAINAAGIRVEPMLEMRGWVQDAKPASLPTSTLTNVGLRLQFNVLGVGVAPSAGYSMGQLAAQTNDGVSTTANITGFRGLLTVQLR